MKNSIKRPLNEQNLKWKIWILNWEKVKIINHIWDLLSVKKINHSGTKAEIVKTFIDKVKLLDKEKNPEKYKYKFSNQLWYYELKDVIKTKWYNKWTKEEVDDLLKNEIVEKAYIQEWIVMLITHDKQARVSRIPWIVTDFGKKVAETDYSEPMTTTKNTYLYPKNILAYKKIWDNSVETITKNWVFSSHTWLPKAFINKFVKRAKENWAVKLPTIYWWDDWEKLLIQQWIRQILKKAS